MAVKFLWPVGGALMQCFKAFLEATIGREERKERECKEEKLLQQTRMPPKRYAVTTPSYLFWLVVFIEHITKLSNP